MLAQMLASNIAAEALHKAEQQSLKLLDQIEEHKTDAKAYKDQLKKYEQDLGKKDVEVKFYQDKADEFNE